MRAVFAYLNCKLAGVKPQVMDKFVRLTLCCSHVYANVWAMIIINMHVGILLAYECS